MTAASSALQCTCPDAIRADNHRCKTEKWWEDPDYRARSAAFLEAHPVCEYCKKRKSTVVHHDSRDSYRSKEEYFDLEKNGTPACHTCHDRYRAGYIICPQCGDHYILKNGKHEICRYCRGMKYAGLPRKGKPKPLRHPCAHRMGLQRCQRGDGRIYVCSHSAGKCRDDCRHFAEREKGVRA